MSQSDASLVTLSSSPAVTRLRRDDARESSPIVLDVPTSPTLSAQVARASQARYPDPRLDPLVFSSSSPAPTPPPPPKRQARAQRHGLRAAKQAERVQSAASRQRWREANRVRRRRADTMRDLIVHMDAALMQDGGLLQDVYTQVRERLEDDEATVHVVPRATDCAMLGSIAFERKVRSTYDPVQHVWEPLEREQVVREPTTVIVMDAKRLVNADGEADIMAELHTHSDAKDQCIVLVLGLDALLKHVRSEQNRAYAERIRQRMDGHASQVHMPHDDTRTRIEQRVLTLQLVHACHVVQIAKRDEAVEWIHALACDVSIRPYKLLQAEAPPKRQAKAADDGLPAYRAMLEEIPRCTTHVSAAIVARYPTLMALMQALSSSPDVLADLVCDGGRQARRVGPQLSRRIHAVFTSRDAKAPAE